MKINLKKNVLNGLRIGIFAAILISVFIFNNRQLQVFAYTEEYVKVDTPVMAADANAATEPKTEEVAFVEQPMPTQGYSSEETQETAKLAATATVVNVDVGDTAVWDALAACESGGNWATNTGNGYYGGVQFSLATWQSVAPRVGVYDAYPHLASKEDQIKAATWLQQNSGWGQWPACSAKLGLI